MTEFPSPEPTRGRLVSVVPVLVLLTTLVADQATKRVVEVSMHYGQSIPEVGFFRFTYVTNTGMAFGLFPSQTILPAAASFLGIIVLLVFYRSRAVADPRLKLSLGLQLGGAIGNLVDRVRLGHVIDFLDVGSWPVFNVADSAIVVGLALLLWTLATEGGRRKPAPEVEYGYVDGPNGMPMTSDGQLLPGLGEWIPAEEVEATQETERRWETSDG